MNEVLNSLKTRRSIRAYKDTQVPDELLDQVLEAGLYAARFQFERHRLPALSILLFSR